MNPTRPRQLPSPKERDQWRRLFLPGLTKKVEGDARQNLIQSYGLDDIQVDTLLAEYAVEQVKRVPYAERRQRGRGWEGWAISVLEIEVRIMRAGRVVLRDPRRPYRVEIYFTEHEQGLDARRIEVLPASVGVNTLFDSAPDLQRYWAAFILALARKEGKALHDGSVPIERPQAGKAFEEPFYLALIDAEAALKRQGHPAPAKDLAQRYGVPHATMRSWLSRGHKRLGE